MSQIGVGPAGQQPLGRPRAGPRGEVEVVLLAPEHRVAHRAADQGQLLAGVGEAGAELVDDGTDPVELGPDRGAGSRRSGVEAERRRTRQASLRAGLARPSN